MLRRAPRWLVPLFVLLVAPGHALAVDASDAPDEAMEILLGVEKDLPDIRKAFERVKGAQPSIERRIARGQLLKETGDHEGAIVALSKVVELFRQGRAPETAYADGLFLLAETYFEDEQYLSAKRHYEELVDKGTAAPYAAYAGRALARLVDVALRTDHLDGLDWVFARMADLPSGDASGALQYARGKAHFARGDYAEALSLAALVPADSPFVHQAGYLKGVIQMKQALPADGGAPDPASVMPALEEFRRTAERPAETEDQRHVVDLAWMAIGRLSYEAGNYLTAVEAYSHVDRKSPEFTDTLFELGWVYVKMGDYARAERALEVLAITSPESLRFADGPLLRADLGLRAGKFDEALDLYETVRAEYDPMQRQVADFIAGHTDPSGYYDLLVKEDIEQQRAGVPPNVLAWVREEAKDDHVFSIIDDVARSRRLVRESRDLAKKLRVALGAPSRVKSFPEVKAALERTVGLLNRVALLQHIIAEGAEDADDSGYGGELGQIRGRRRQLMKRVVALPRTSAQFATREARSARVWNAVGQKIKALHVEADRLAALANGLRRIKEDPGSFPGAQNPATQQRLQMELRTIEGELSAYRRFIEQYREAVDLGRLQVGFGDESFMEDERARAEFSALVRRELALLATGAGGGDARDYALSVQEVLGRTERSLRYLETVKRDLEYQVAQSSAALGALVDGEARNVEAYAQSLDVLDRDARGLVGQVAMENFQKVGEHLRSIVLRADVGIFQQAWEIRDAQRERVRALQRERAREERLLNEELRDVLDDGVTP